MNAALSIFATSLMGLVLVMAGTRVRAPKWRDPILVAGTVICVVAVLSSIAMALGVLGNVEG